MCMMDGDTCAVWHETEQRSAKDRTCDCCNQPIKKGEMYMKHRSLFEGRWWNEVMCLPCKAMRACFADDPHHMLTVPSAFPPTLWECVDHFDRNDKWVALMNQLQERRGNEPLAWQSDDTENHSAGSWA